MKYIDADKLRVELKKRMGEYDVQQTTSERPDYEQGAMDALYNLNLQLNILNLWQEWPKLPGYDKALLEVKGKVDELYEETSIGLSEYDSGLYNGIAETCMKLRGFIKARLDSEEQPEVDFEKAYKSYIGNRKDDVSGCAVTVNMKDLARHFYELGRNARK